MSNTRKAIAYGVENIVQRDPSGKKPLVFLMDGYSALRKAVDECVRHKGLEQRVMDNILDIIHLLEYVWGVANAVWCEKHPGLENGSRLSCRSCWKAAATRYCESGKSF